MPEFWFKCVWWIAFNKNKTGSVQLEWTRDYDGIESDTRLVEAPTLAECVAKANEHERRMDREEQQVE